MNRPAVYDLQSLREEKNRLKEACKLSELRLALHVEHLRESPLKLWGIIFPKTFGSIGGFLSSDVMSAGLGSAASLLLGNSAIKAWGLGFAGDLAMKLFRKYIKKSPGEEEKTA